MPKSVEKNSIKQDDSEDEDKFKIQNRSLSFK